MLSALAVVPLIMQLTSPRGISGGPAAMSEDLVPGCILRPPFASIILCSIVGSCEELPRDGDLGPICISVGGGGLGSRGELGGRDMLVPEAGSLLTSASDLYNTQLGRRTSIGKILLKHARFASTYQTRPL